RVGLRNLPRQREHQGDRVLGRGDRVAERRVHHDDAAGGRRRDVDIVDPDAGPADHLEAFRLVENLPRDLGGRANRQAIEAVDDGGEALLVLAEVRLEIHLEAAILEDLNRGGRQRIGDEDFRRHGYVTPPWAAPPWPWRRPSRAMA